MAKIGVIDAKKASKKPRFASNGNRLPDPLPNGVILTDVMKRQWRLGKAIGLGGFGEIYLASDDTKRKPGPHADYVVKVEPHTNGPLFSEMHFYHRVGKSEQIEEWKLKKKLNFLGMPKFIGSGSHEFKGIKYRFMVMERFGEDLQKKLGRNNKVFPMKTVYTIGKMVLDILEYVHSHGYIHADVKASNLLTGYTPDKANEVYLIDFGLACRYITNGQHKELKEDLRKAHDGTIEFTSRDAHIGAHSRRGDLETLGYNMLQWLSGRLPWEENLKDVESVSRQKSMYMSNISSLIKSCFPRAPPRGITEYFTYIAGLTFEEEPDYKHCKNIFSAAIKASSFQDDGLLIFTSDDLIKQTAHKNNKRPAGRGSCSFSPPAKLKKLHDSSEGAASPIPQRKLRRVASATQSMQASGSGYNGSSNSLQLLENPTPAMLLVMQRKLERHLQVSNLHTTNLVDQNNIKDLILADILPRRRARNIIENGYYKIK